jgi:hypothetical protein
MSDRSAFLSEPSFAPSKSATPPTPAAARTKLLLEGPILPTLLRLAAPNILNLLAFAGVITFDGFFLGRIGARVTLYPLADPFFGAQRAARNAIDHQQGTDHLCIDGFLDRCGFGHRCSSPFIQIYWAIVTGDRRWP